MQTSLNWCKVPELQETGIRCQVLCECKEFQGLGLHLHTYFPTGENMTQDEIIEMARQAGLWPAVTDIFLKELEAFAKLVAQHEREACAKVCDDHFGWTPRMIGETIRARGQA
jgi:hypothetical protein